MRNLFSLIGVFLTTACSQASFGIVNTPTYFSDVNVVKDVAYGQQPWERLDIYLPPDAKKSKTPLPVIVFYYGGRWTDGSRGQYRFAGNAFAKKGFITVIPDYRKYPDVKFPAFVEDGAASLSWTFDNIVRYGGDTRRINVSGHSAGAHVGAILSTDPKYLKVHGKNPKDVIHAFAVLSGPYSFTPDEPDLIDMFGPPENYPQMQATTFVTGKEPPMFLAWGEDDTSVRAFNHERLAKAIHDKGGCAQLKTYPGVSHIGMAAALTWTKFGKPDVAEDVAAFLKNPSCLP